MSGVSASALDSEAAKVPEPEVCARVRRDCEEKEVFPRGLYPALSFFEVL